MKDQFIRAILFIVILAVAADAQLAGGGNFTLEQSVIAAGGGRSSGGQFIVEGTDAQSIAGTRSTDSTKGLHGGFWNGSPLVPTASNVAISGRVLTKQGQGIRSILVTLTEGNGTIHTTVTGSFGYYNFAEIAAGQNIVISVTAKRFVFSQPSVVLSITENLSEINFIANDF